MSKRAPEVRTLIVVSDLHAACRLSVCPPDGVPLDDGGRYMPSAVQLKLYGWWREFWDEWVPQVTKGEPFAVVVNGDALDGVHHNSVTQYSHNHADQIEAAYRLLEPVVAKARGGYYHVRGTEAHVGPSAQHEELLARRLGAIPNEDGQYSRWELRVMLGDAMIHLTHHVGTTGSNHYESTAVHKELIEAFTEAGRWGERPPDVVVRSHRHRCIETRIPGRNGYCSAIVTAGWQLRTPFAFRIAGGRASLPQIGGTMLRTGDEDRIYARHWVRSLTPPPAVRPSASRNGLPSLRRR